MSASVVISCQNLAKTYRIYQVPQDRLKHAFGRRLLGRTYGRDFQALHDLSFEVKEGETVGVIGRNGSGKSTLLQLIAGVLKPTAGSIRVGRRVTALLELGSGFNPQFTGRENVYLNGSLLGVPHRTIARRFDDIAGFAEIGDFIDQPVKIYSSGMVARLAFAVSMMLDPEILAVDEVLAVGDIAFQHKCITRLRSLQAAGVTILLVSHSPDAVKSICQRGLYLDAGRLKFDGPADQAVSHYLRDVRLDENAQRLGARSPAGGKPQALPAPSPVDPAHFRFGAGHCQLIAVELFDDRGEGASTFAPGEWINLRLTAHVGVPIETLSFGFVVRDDTGVDLFGDTTFNQHLSLGRFERGARPAVTFRFRNYLHGAKSYSVYAAINSVSAWDRSDNIILDQIENACVFRAMHDPEWPCWYKVFQPCSIYLDSRLLRAAADHPMAQRGGEDWTGV